MTCDLYCIDEDEPRVGERVDQLEGGRTLLLASRSPRRRLLLDRAGFAHDAEHPGFDDAVLQPGAVSPDEWVMALAYLKAWARALEAAPGRVVLGADTACLLDGALVGTPRDENEARSMLRAFVNRAHEVVTGVALVESGSGRRRMFAERATVRFGDLSDDAIDRYVATHAWEGKAGAYNLAERLDAGWPIEFQGEDSTIMGLPLTRLTREYETFIRGGQAA